MTEKIRIGSRKSRLAMVQTNMIIEKLKLISPNLEFEIIPISTIGDEILDKPLISFGGKGVFVDAFEDALLTNKIDLAVHSAKDMPMELPKGLGILGIPAREDPRDVLISYEKELDPRKLSVIGTSSLRRQFQIEQYYRSECKSLRGNVPTRLEKLKSGEYDGIILAVAGLKRLGIIEEERYHYHYFSTEEFVPAAGQGIIAVEGRLGGELEELVGQMNDADTVICLKTERQIIRLLEAGCHEAIGVYSRIEQGEILVQAIYQKENGILRAKERLPVSEYLHAASLVAGKLA